jgi:hypothetical protein
MIVLHVLLFLPELAGHSTRNRVYKITRQNIRWALTTREGASLAIKLILRTGLLEQFQLYASETHGMRVQPARETEEERGEEGEEEEEEEEEEEKEERE